MNIRDIAKLAEVSASTVSKVMNGNDKDISEKTKRKVLEVIERENYTPYSKFLKKKGIKNKLIGLILRKENREWKEIVLAVESRAKLHGYHVLVTYVDQEAGLEPLAEELMKREVSGVLIDSPQWVQGIRSDCAVVYLNEEKDFDKRQSACFYYQLSEAGKIATRKLLEAGHKKIACLALHKENCICEGYCCEMQANHYASSQIRCYEEETIDEIEKYAVPQCINDCMTAVICSSAQVASRFYKILAERQMAILEAISVIVIGDDETLEVMGCGVSSVRLPSRCTAEEATEYLISTIQNETKAEIIKENVPIFIEGESVEKLDRTGKKEKIVIVGSLNSDVMIEVEKIPLEGETLTAETVYVTPGGKGGNQAVGVGKLGGQSYMIGCLGNDPDGEKVYKSLIANGVHMEGVLFDQTLPTGKAYINVAKGGESNIVLYAGANHHLNEKQISSCRFLFESAQYCLLSMEIPEMITEYTIKFCTRTHTKVILKPSVTKEIKAELYSDIDYLVPNEKELHVLVPGEGKIEEKAAWLQKNGIKNVIVTMGSRGCYLKTKELSLYFEGTSFRAIDTTGGADSFISALAVQLSEGRDLLYSICYAVYASGISVTRRGVQPALPDREMVEVYKEEIRIQYEQMKERANEENRNSRKSEYGLYP